MELLRAAHPDGNGVLLRLVHDLVMDYNPAFATADILTPRDWVNKGCDVDLDILPTIEGILTWAKRRGVTIRSYSYFTKAVIVARDKRLQTKVIEPKSADPQCYRRKLQRLAWLRAMKPGQYAQYRGELESYELVHGPVVPCSSFPAAAP